jgi:hypothetical protein
MPSSGKMGRNVVLECSFINGDVVLFNISPPKLLIYNIQIKTFTSRKLLHT